MISTKVLVDKETKQHNYIYPIWFLTSSSYVWNHDTKVAQKGIEIVIHRHKYAPTEADLAPICIPLETLLDSRPHYIL